MLKNSEIELKLAIADPNAWERIISSPVLAGLQQVEPSQVAELKAYYFDTPDGALKKAQLAYRIRRENDRWIATVKAGGSADGGLHQRQEWNVEVVDKVPDLEPFSDMPIWPVLTKAVGDQPLGLLFVTCFTRYIFDINTANGSLIEAAVDKGEIRVADGRTEQILEVELELKCGQPVELLKLGAQLAGTYPLLPEARSKYFRGIMLAGLAKDDRDSMFDIELKSDQEVGLSLKQAIIVLICRLLAAQDAFLHQSGNPDNVHNLRVELRRLRSLLAFAQPLLPAQDYLHYKQELSKWGQELGPLREVDVMIEAWSDIKNEHAMIQIESNRLSKLLAERRLQEVQEVLSSLKQGRSTSLILSLWAWVLEHNWQTDGKAKLSLRQYSAARMQQWFKRMLKTAKDLNLAEEESVHRVRIKGKKLRYALEIFRPIMNDDVGILLKRLKTLQDELGFLHDTHFTYKYLQQLCEFEQDCEARMEAGMMLGWNWREHLFIERKMARHLKAFRKAGLHWLTANK